MKIANSAEEVEQEIEKSSNIILLDFYANWCGPCKRLTPKLEEMENEFPNVIFIKINVDDLDELSEKYSIKCMPTIIFKKNNDIVNRIEGSNIDEIRTTLNNFGI